MSLQPFALPDRYRLEGGIAAGGMAAVYAAHDTVLDRPVAVKVLADHLNDDETARRRFEREARAAASLSNHAGVVTIFDVGEHNGRSFIVMERRDGGTIGDAGQVGRDRALRWLRTVAGALDAAHEGGVVHRDIKPGNLLLDDRGEVAVADFGIASIATESERFTQTGQVLGTAAYLSPEQACGEPATPASDRYSLAVVAYELLTGEKPFTTANFAAQARAHIEEPPPAAPGLPREAQDVLKRGLAKRPEDRWPSAEAFVDALEQSLADAPAAAPVPAPTEASKPLPPTPVPEPRRAAPAAGPVTTTRRRRIGPILAATALALVLVAAGAIALSGGDGDDEPATTSADKPAADVKPAKDKKKPEATPEAAETTAPAPVAPEETATEEPVEAAPPSGDASTLNAQGYELFQAGDYEGSIPYFERSVAACGESASIDPCAYAMYNLGAALNRAGRPDEAIPVLEERLDRWPSDQPETVQAELDDARANAGR